MRVVGELHGGLGPVGAEDTLDGEAGSLELRLDLGTDDGRTTEDDDLLDAGVNERLLDVVVDVVDLGETKRGALVGNRRASESVREVVASGHEAGVDRGRASGLEDLSVGLVAVDARNTGNRVALGQLGLLSLADDAFATNDGDLGDARRLESVQRELGGLVGLGEQDRDLTVTGEVAAARRRRRSRADR